MAGIAALIVLGMLATILGWRAAVRESRSKNNK